MTHPDILILVGTQTGNSEGVAEVVAESLGEVGYTCHVVDMAEAYPEMLPEYRQIVVVMCTWAEGTFPDNTVEFYDALVAVGPDLSEVTFGMIGLGDHDYDPYYLTANLKLSATLAKCGANQVVEMLEINGTPTHRHLLEAKEWAAKVASGFSSTA